MNKELNNSMVCGACFAELLVGEEYLQCMMKTCGKSYHYACNNKALSDIEKASWACPECAAKNGGRNCDAHVGTPVSVKNVTLRKPNDVATSVSTSLELQLLREQITFLTEQLADAVATIGRYHSALTVSTNKIEAISGRLSELENSIASRNPSVMTPSKIPYNEVVKSSKPTCDRTASGNCEQALRASHNNNTAVASEVSLPVVSPVNADLENAVFSTPTANNQPQEVFTQVGQARKHRRLTSIRCTAGPNITSLKAVEHRKYIHLWNMASKTDEVKEYLQSLCPNVSCTVEQLKSKGDYKSYKLGIPAMYYDKCLSADVWPDNAMVKKWLFRGQNGKQQ